MDSTESCGVLCAGRTFGCFCVQRATGQSFLASRRELYWRIEFQGQNLAGDQWRIDREVSTEIMRVPRRHTFKQLP